MRVERILAVVALEMWVELFLVSTADAYLDPGTGSYVCQLLLAGILGTGFVIKMYWTKIKSYLTRFFSKDV